MHSAPVLCVLLTAGVINSVVGQDCAFMPGPITSSYDTVFTTVDCHGRLPHSVGLAGTTGNSTGVVVYLYNCTIVPVGMFLDVTASPSTVTVVSEDSEVLLEGTFEDLANIAELRLEGFQMLQYLSSAVFRPLKNLERLILVGFGAHKLTYADLGAALYALSGTPLSRIVMHGIHSRRNKEKALNITSLFRMQNESVRELVFSNNIIESISGRPSSTLPNLNYACTGVNMAYFVAMNTLIDAWMFLPNITETSFYAYPTPDGPSTFRKIHITDIDIALFKALEFQQNCYGMLKFRLSRSLRRVTMRNLGLINTVIDKPICFDNSNNIEYADWAGSPLPTNSLMIVGLDRLKYFDIQNTGIVGLPNDFLRYFPKLERLNLVQLAIGKWMKHINSSFFGNCPTLREIHLGDCQLTTIPSTAFELLPSLEVLNLSSNSLRTFDANLSNNGNLSHLNLSDNDISTLSEDVLAKLNEIAQLRVQDSKMLTVDLRRNRLSCLCNATHFIRQLQDWIINQEMNLPGSDEYTCLYVNGSSVAVSQVDVHQLISQCSVLGEFKNGSDCPCDDHLRQRLELVRLSLHGYFCRNYVGELMPMSVRSLPSCPNLFISATFIAPVVVGCVLALGLVAVSIVLYRHRKNERLRRIIQRLGMTRIVRLGIQHVLAQNREDPDVFEHDVFLFIQDNDQEAAGRWFDAELSPYRRVLRDDDFSPGLKLETRLRNIWTCRWLVPVLSQSFVDDGECCDFIARAQYARPHAIVPVIWTEFHTDDLTISSLLDTAEPVTWPGDHASYVDKVEFWKTLLERTDSPIDIAM